MPRIYAVETEEALTLVKANSQGQALNHVAKGMFKVKTATAMDVVDYLNQGGEVEDACAEKGAPVEEVPGDPEEQAE